jgi:hypothetical protein
MKQRSNEVTSKGKDREERDAKRWAGALRDERMWHAKIVS